jgi:hypothetical protein
MLTSTINLTGGLGNQLFGAFLGMNLQKRFESEISLNTNDLNQRGYQLIEFEKYFPKEIKLVNAPVSRLNKSQIQLNKVTKKIYFERKFSYDEKVLRRPYHEYFGYFQSWKYLIGVEDTIDTIFESLITAMKNNPDFLKYTAAPYVAVHIRRGDYVNLTHYHGITSENYYKEAMKHVETYLTTQTKVIVFSDDISMAKKVFRDADFYIGPEEVPSSLDNLLLMANARLLIGSNSSFSWWAAFASKKEISIFPEPWFQNSKLDTKDLLPHNWIKIEI